MEKGTENKLMTVGLFIGGGIGAYFVGKKLFDAIRAIIERNQYYKPGNETSKQTIASQLAVKFSAAFNPSGVSWMRAMDQTNEQAVFECARDMNKNKIPWSMVSGAYKGTIGRDLLSDLQSELDSDEIALFNGILTASDADSAYNNAMLKRFGKLNGLGYLNLLK